MSRVFKVHLPVGRNYTPWDGQIDEHHTEEGHRPAESRKGTFAGYCPKCKGMIASLDKTGRHTFKCPQCGKKTARSKLRTTPKVAASRAPRRTDGFMLRVRTKEVK